MLDYIIVGFGLSGLAFVEQLENNNKSYVVYENNSQQSSKVAGGLYNPIILKRFTPAWRAIEHLEMAKGFYKNLESKIKVSLMTSFSILRRFHSIEEQNTWFEACGKPIMKQFLVPKLKENKNPMLDAPYHYGEVLHTGRVDIPTMLSSYVQYLLHKKRFIKESFSYEAIEIHKDYISYKGMKTKNIVFAEGYGVKKNPFFNYLPLVGNKGEYIIIRSTSLQLTEAVKSAFFIIPMGEDVYKIGATYNNEDKSSRTTVAAKDKIIKKLQEILQCEFEILDQVAGIRPTVKDRKPLVGTHPKYQNIHILNGMGSRGIVLAPSVAEELYNAIENKSLLDAAIDIKRYESLQ